MKTLEIIQGLTLLISFYKEQAKNSFNSSILNAPLVTTSCVGQNYLDIAHGLESQLLSVKDDFLREARLNVSNIVVPTQSIITAPSLGTVRETSKVEEPTVIEQVADVVEMEQVIEEVTTANISLPELLKNNSVERANIAEMWHTGRKDEAYARYAELLPNSTASRTDRKQELSRIASEMKAAKTSLEIKELEEKVNKLALSTKSSITRPFTGEELVARSSKYTVDGQFDIIVLTGSDDENDTPAEDLIRLKAKQLQAAGNEQAAIDHIQTLYAEKGMTKEMARNYLYKLVREDGNSELKLAIMALLSYGYVEKGDYHTMLSHCNNLVKMYSRAKVGTDDKGNDIYKFWKDSKINNFVDSCVNALVERGVFEKSELAEKLETKALVDAETSIVTEEVKEVTEVVAEKPLSRKEQRAAKFREERVAKKVTTKEVKSVETKEVQASATKTEDTKELNIGRNLYEYHVNEVHNIYTTEGYLNARAVSLLTQLKDKWFSPFKLFDLNFKSNQKACGKIIDVLMDCKINPEDFQIVNDANEICRVYRYNVYTKTTEGKWQNYAGQGIPTEEQVQLALGTGMSAAPIALPEVTETKKAQASVQTVPTTEDLSQQTIAADATHSEEALEPTMQHEVIDVKDGVKAILHPAAKQFFEKSQKEVTAMIIATKKGFNAFIQGFKEVKVENAKTIEEAQAELSQQVIDFSQKATDHNDKVAASGKGKRISLPAFLKDGFEGISLVFKMKEKPAMAV